MAAGTVMYQDGMENKKFQVRRQMARMPTQYIRATTANVVAMTCSEILKI